VKGRGRQGGRLTAASVESWPGRTGPGAFWRQRVDHAARKSDGESTANYLYHALAMNQVLSSPPTLAQWKPPRLKQYLLHLVFFVPVMVEGYIIYVNSQTLSILHVYGVGDEVMFLQYGLVVLNLLIAMVAMSYVRACNARWRTAFFYINPALRFVASPPWRLWLKWPRAAPSDSIERSLWAQAIEQLTLAPERSQLRSRSPTVLTCMVLKLNIGTCGGCAPN
jgi:hypothetical protein